MLNEVKIKLLDKKLKDIPTFSTKGSAGLDLRASLESELILKSKQTELIPTGISIHIENQSYAGLILPRSGLGHNHGIVLGNLVGLIDSDYQGQLFVSCWNRSDVDYKIEPYDRIAQLIFITIDQPKFKVVDTFEKSIRGSDGFGSSGKK
jgi:dUTP pyrophosphatase